MANQAVFQQLALMLQGADLGDLLAVDANGNPVGWLADQIRNGVDTEDELWAAIEATDVFRQRYATIVAQRQAAAEGRPVRVQTVAEVRQEEDEFRRLARFYNLPAGMYDSYQDFQRYQVAGITPQMFESAALDSWRQLQQAPAEVRQVFAEWYGPRGDSMLAAYLFDPEQVNMNLSRMTTAAVAGGYARKYGFDMGKDLALQLVDMGRGTPGAIAEGFTRIESQQDLFAETAFETQDMRAGVEGVQAEFDLPGGGTARQDLSGRVNRRQADFGGGGGAGESRTGLVGLGAAR